MKGREAIFFLLKLTSINIASNLISADLKMSFDGISSLTNIIIPPPLSFRSNLYDVNPSIKNCPRGKEASNLFQIS